ncbi:MAG TPA: alpha/beta hydrolase [Arachidicoccus sp.]
MKTCITLVFVFFISFIHAQIHKEIAEIFINDLSREKYQEAESLTDSIFQKSANENVLKTIWLQANQQLGTYNQIDSSKKYNNQAYIVFIDFAKAKQKFIISFNKDGKIVGMGNGGTFFKKSKTDDTLAFLQKDLAIQVKGGRIYGSLLMPKNSNKQTPLALIIAGSGPTDRNGNDNALGLNCYSYQMLADSLARNGIASFRYDKRFSGKSVESTFDKAKFSFDNYVGDADSIALFFKTKYSKIYVIGHSEGSLVGILLSQKESLAGFISLAGAGENIALTLKRQLAQMPDTAEVARVLSNLQNGKTVDSVPANLQLIFSSSVQPYLISWMKYDPQKEIAKLRCPILILQGNHDMQVTVQDAQNLKAGSRSAHLVIIDSMNHILKNVPMDKMQNIATYSNPNLPLNKELINAIVSFIKK